MPLIASEDYVNKLIFLGPDSVGVEVLPIDIYTEHRERRRLNSGSERNFFPMVSAFGNESAGPSNTPRFTNLAQGVRIVPFDVNHSLLVRGALISTDEGLAGRDLFDRSPLTPGVEVDIDYQPPQVEIIEVNTGSAVTNQDKIDIASLVWTRLLTVSQDLSTFGGLVQFIKKILVNRASVSVDETGAGTSVIFDDDKSTPLQTFVHSDRDNRDPQ